MRHLHLWVWVWMFILIMAVNVMGEEFKIEEPPGSFVKLTICARDGTPRHSAWIRKSMLVLIQEGTSDEVNDAVHENCSLVYVMTRDRVHVIGTPRDIMEKLR